MGWGLVASIASTALSFKGARDANKEAKKQRAIQERQIALEEEAMRNAKEEADRQFQYQQEVFEYQKEDDAYRRRIEELNREIQREQREFLMSEAERDRIFKMEDRADQIERQIEQDKEAARLQAFQLENILRNRQLGVEEREFVRQQLERAQSLAAGERDDDLRRFLTAKAQKEIERDFLMGEYDSARKAAQRERDFDIAERERVASTVMGLRSALQEARGELGDMIELPTLTPESIEAEIMRRTGEYQQDVDRAAQAVASVGEADLIRRGMDTGTAATQKRGDITARIADEYQDARNRAYDDALKYISGQTDALASNVNARNAQRGQKLSEVAQVEGAGIDQLLRLPNVGSTQGAYNLMRNVPTAAYDRAIQSGIGPNYRLPSAQSTDYRNLQSSLSPYMSRLSPSVFGDMAKIESAVFNPYDISDLTASATYGQLGLNALTDIYKQAGMRANQTGNAMDAYREQEGRGYASFLEGLGSIVTGFGNLGGGSTPAPTPSPSIGFGPGMGMSDVRLKENIEHVGNTNGINLYSWTWNEEGEKIAGGHPTFGVMAHEIKDVIPNSVIESEDGYLMVDYGVVSEYLEDSHVNT